LAKLFDNGDQQPARRADPSSAQPRGYSGGQQGRGAPDARQGNGAGRGGGVHVQDMSGFKRLEAADPSTYASRRKSSFDSQANPNSHPAAPRVGKGSARVQKPGQRPRYNSTVGEDNIPSYDYRDSRQALRAAGMWGERRRISSHKYYSANTYNIGALILEYVLVCAILFVAVYLFMFIGTHTNSAPKNYQLKLTVAGKTTSSSLDASKYYINGEYYIPLNTLAGALKIQPGGDAAGCTLALGASGSLTYDVAKKTYSIDNTPLMGIPPAIGPGNELYVPYSLIASYVAGGQYSVNATSHTVTLSFADPAAVAAAAADSSPLPDIDELAQFGSIYMPVTFKTDISAFQPYFNPPDLSGYLILVNAAHPIAQDYAPPDLTDVVDTRQDGRAMQQMRQYAEKSLQALLQEARAQGFNITVTSAYRDYNEQDYLYEQQVASLTAQGVADAADAAATSVARPGTSEHQTGLAVDMHTEGEATQDFANTADGQWLIQNAPYFGFILRYPSDKSDITGIEFEPWHFRYVGQATAMKIAASGMCLEEYLQAQGLVSDAVPAGTGE